MDIVKVFGLIAIGGILGFILRGNYFSRDQMITGINRKPAVKAKPTRKTSARKKKVENKNN